MSSVTLERIIEETAAEYATSSAALLGRDRHQNVCVARRAAVHVARAEGYSFSEIGLAFDRDHTTIVAIGDAARVDLAGADPVKFAIAVKRIKSRMRKPAKDVPAKKTPRKQRDGGVYFLRVNGESFYGSNDGWGCITEECKRFEWTERARAKAARDGLRALIRSEGGDAKVTLVWSNTARNRETPGRAVNKAGRESRR